MMDDALQGEVAIYGDEAGNRAMPGWRQRAEVEADRSIAAWVGSTHRRGTFAHFIAACST